MLKTPLALVDFLVLTVVFQWLRSLRRQRGAKYPPGPPGYPLIGNVYEILAPELWKRIWEARKTYGGLIYLRSFGHDIVVINSYDVAVELLETRSLNYSDRPKSVMLNDLQRWDWLFVTQNYTESWKKMRTPTQRFLEPTNIINYEHVLDSESQKLLRSLLQTPENYEPHIRAAIASLIMMITYGHEVVSEDDPFVSLVKEGNEQLVMAMRNGAFLVDVIPWLKYVPKWFPGAGFQAVAEHGKKLSHAVRYRPFTDAKEKIFAGTAVRSFTSEQIAIARGDDGELSEKDEEIISAITGICYLGGADTTVSSLMTFMLAMTLYPEAQKRAQEEIDNFTGGDRLPVVSDRPQLPYCEALFKEVTRWQPVSVLGGAHATTNDDIYNGYFIPAKTTVMANQWGMLRDPVEYPQPEVFRPERFMPKNGERMPRDPSKIAFGFGRRACAGKYLAENIVFIVIVRILASFNISKSMDDKGNIIEPVVKRSLDGVVSCTHQFECTIKPRSKKAEELIMLE